MRTCRTGDRDDEAGTPAPSVASDPGAEATHGDCLDPRAKVQTFVAQVGFLTYGDTAATQYEAAPGHTGGGLQYIRFAIGTGFGGSATTA
jgi:hypothetical protein